MPVSWLHAATSTLVARLQKKSLAYWIRLVIAVVIVQLFVAWADNKGYITGYRYAFHRLLQKASPNKPVDQNTVVITIDDDEYWKGGLQGRVPIKRDYLARLIETLDAADAKVIAVDFDLRSPDPDGNPAESADYLGETKKLLETIKSVAARRPIVLPRTIGKENGEYVTNSDIYDGYDFQSQNVFKGYIALTVFHLEVPLTLKLRGDVPLDSFSMAVARAYRSKALKALPQADHAYASFIGEDGFDHKTAHDVLAADPNVLRQDLGCRVVIIGGGWSKWAYGVGPRIDLHETPMGWMPGAYLHANYVEAILGAWTYPPFGKLAVKAIEWLVVVGMALGFAVVDSPGWKIGVVPVSWLLLGLFSYFSFINLGIVFDLFVPALSVTVHWLFEHFWEGFQAKAAKT